MTFTLGQPPNPITEVFNPELPNFLYLIFSSLLTYPATLPNER